MIEGRDAALTMKWLQQLQESWLAGIEWGTLDLSGPYRLVFATMLAHAGRSLIRSI